MGKIHRSLNSDLFALISQNNLERQFSLLTDMVNVGIQVPSFRINRHIICALNSTATVHLVDEPGVFRREDVHITGSTHSPPGPLEIADLTNDLVFEVRARWQEANTFELAAYVLWRLVWIHPFEDGNGRTARALSYLVICLKERTLLFGSQSYLSIIRDRYADVYLDLIRHADRTCSKGNADIMPLAEFLAEIVAMQLESTP